MSIAWFCPLVSLPIIIDEPGDYITRGGERITISVASTSQDFKCLGVYPEGVCDGWHRSGRLYFSMPSNNDIVAKAPKLPETPCD